MATPFSLFSELYLTAVSWIFHHYGTAFSCLVVTFAPPRDGEPAYLLRDEVSSM